MRLSSRLLIAASLIALSACGDAEKAGRSNKAAAVSGRQEVKLRLAHATEDAGDFAGAERMFLQVVSQSPDTGPPRVELAEFYRRHHQDRKAIESLNEAVRLEPDDTSVQRELANTYIGIGEPEKALEAVDKAMMQNRADPLLYNTRGVALDQIGDYNAAQKSYNKAYDIDPAGGSMYKVNLSMSYVLSGKYDKAIDLLRPMLDQPDAPPIIRQNLALAYGLKGDSDTALKLGLKDLSTTEAEENIRFYRMLALRHASGKKTAGRPVAPVPPSVVTDLFPSKDTPDKAGDEKPAPVPVQTEVTPAPLEEQPETVVKKEVAVAPVVITTVAPAPIAPALAAEPTKPAKTSAKPAEMLSPSSNGRNEPVKPAMNVPADEDSSLPEPMLKPDQQ